MGIKEEAVALHNKGFNCAQAVLCACCKYTGLDESIALSIAGGMGGGVRCGEICGAVSGAVMALGLITPYNNSEDTDAKARIADDTREFVAKFKEQFGCVRCLELKAKGISCNQLIGEAAEITEKMILDRRK